uniref:Ribonuclease T2,domain-containing protein n=1 Tax=Schistosoma japonicum TaxID=6182 RepID=C1L5V8_SCHJA|nr:Ribonuclease T2,domain-containing protein [Schistosoma japonicum]
MHSISMISIVLIFISIFNVGYTNRTRNWDYLQLILVWPPSYCSYNSCNLRPGLDDFTIGGFWPTIRPYTKQTNCTNERQFNMSHIQRVKAKLEKKWPNLTDYTNSEGLWESEWNHHGRCALQARSTRNQRRYFKAALSLLDNLDLLDKLDDYGIEPDSETLVRKNQFLKTIRKVYNVRALLKCIPFDGKRPNYEYTSPKDNLFKFKYSLKQ